MDTFGIILLLYYSRNSRMYRIARNEWCVTSLDSTNFAALVRFAEHGQVDGKKL